MILDSLQHAERYYSLHPLFKQAFQFLQEADVQNLPTGKHELAGEDLFAILSEGPGVAKADAKMEAHQRYIDIQYIVSGVDHMGWQDLSACGASIDPYSVERDVSFFAVKPTSWFDVPAGFFTVFFPNDVHAPLATQEVVRKVVLKIAVQP
ncbi:YhcH/YjgK/YiaL family protein [Rufibacter quisquiliarum]|uniref:YhcH/YjgK/YiaL family protein n=1 Tax=Rufibacter quisquiliarum TaxID=1549639 RepID=A0A839GTR6_9BACT|nr:YhcH/YjgK/YiaL family protein [Rufibacter quisquiliarum]MBA9078267.1 YhcH/YjgK/YiaL family protein [Rufibacter quisquiliarum]